MTLNHVLVVYHFSALGRSEVAFYILKHNVALSLFVHALKSLGKVVLL